MRLEELNRLIADGENDRFECKETTGQRAEACRTLCAFLNGDGGGGGAVFFGVSHKGRLTGKLVSDKTKRDLSRAFCDFEPGIKTPNKYVTVDDSHQAIVCRVTGGPRKPYAYDGRPYRRVQSTTTKMSQEQYAALIANRGGFQSKWELQWDENVSLADIDLEEVTRTAKIAVAEGRLSPEVNVNDPKDLLRRFGLLKGDLPLNGAMALFGKDLTFFPQCILKVAVQGIFPGMASTPRNPTIAKVLYLRKAIEMWGRGIGLILKSCQEARLTTPKIYEDRGFVYTVFTRPTAQEWQEKVGEEGGRANVGTNGTDVGTNGANSGTNVSERLLECIGKQPRLNQNELAERIGVSRRTIARMIVRLKDQGRLHRIGGTRGQWEVCR